METALKPVQDGRSRKRRWSAEQKLAVTTKELRDAFFGFIGYPRLTDETVLKKAIMRGVLDGTFGNYGQGELVKDPAGVYQIKREQVAIGKTISEDEIDLSSGSILLPKAIPPEKELALTPPEGQITPPEGPPGQGTQPPSGGTGPLIQRSVHLEFNANEAQLYKAWGAIGNLAKEAGTVKVEVDAQSEKGFDPNWLRNAVFEPLEEVDLIKDKKKEN